MGLVVMEEGTCRIGILLLERKNWSGGQIIQFLVFIQTNTLSSSEWGV